MVVVLCTCQAAGAAELARALVEEKLAACVNIVPGVRSIYMWQGEIHNEAESMLLLKTTPECVERLSERLRALHSYDLPEIVVLETGAATDARYRDWVRAAVRR